MEVTLKVFWIPDDVMDLIADRHSVDVSNFETETRTFYVIDSIAPFEGNFCQIVSHGCDFVAKATYEFVRKKISENRKQAMFNDN